MSTAETTTSQVSGSGSSSADHSRRNQVMIGDLPQDFLRAEGMEERRQHGQPVQPAQSSQSTQHAYPNHPAQPIWENRTIMFPATQQVSGTITEPATHKTTLSVTIVQARLNKNYGLTKMDLFCCVRLGHTVRETHTAVKGAKNPYWNKTVHMDLVPGVDTICVDIFNKGSFSQDDRVAWAEVKIPQAAKNGETVDQWFDLSGRMGEGQEGAVNLVMSVLKRTTTSPQVSYSRILTAPIMPPVPAFQICPPFNPYPTAYIPPPPVYISPAAYTAPVTPASAQTGAFPSYPVTSPQSQTPQLPRMTDEDLGQVKEMFPDVDEEVIRSVFQSNHGNKDATVNTLLAFSSVQ